MSVTAQAIANYTIKAFEASPVRTELLKPVGVFTISLAAIVVVARLYCRYFLTKKVWWDDAVIFVALLASIGYCVEAIKGEGYGWGHHAKDIPPLPYYVVNILKSLFLFDIFWTWSMGLTRTAILLFYVRITSGGAHPTFRRLAFLFIILNSIWMIIVTALFCLQCTPTSNFWTILDHAERARACRPFSASLASFMGYGSSSTVLDFVVLILPLKYLFALTLPLAQKIVVIWLFGLGILATIAGAVRVYETRRDFDTVDTTWNAGLSNTLTMVECNVAIICASVPAIKPLAVRLFTRGRLGKVFNNGRSDNSSLPSFVDNKGSPKVAVYHVEG